MEYILDLLYIYVAIYSVYFFILAVRNLKDKSFKLQKKYSQYEEKKHLSLLIYSHNNKNALENIINQIKMQEYPLNCFSVYAILDNCTDGSEDVVLKNPFVQGIRVNGDEQIANKDKAYSSVLEQLKDASTYAFVFLDSTREIESNFLANINAGLSKNDVLTGETVIYADEMDAVERIKYIYNKYCMNFIKRARGLFGLACEIDSNALVVKKSILDSIGVVDFTNKYGELKFGLLLSRMGYNCIYNPNIQTFTNIDNYIFSRIKLSDRIRLFSKCLKNIKTKNFKYIEYVFSLINPNFLFLIFAYAILMKHSYKYYFFVDFRVVLFTFMIFTGGFIISLVNSKLSFREIIILFTYPIYSICHIIKNFPPVRIGLRKIFDYKVGNDKDKLSIDIVVATPKCDLPCKIEFISNNGLYKIKFIYKNKKFITSEHLRMIDALGELKSKLYDYGFTLKICNCCTYFQPDTNDCNSMLKGFCSCDYPSPSIKEPKPTLIWNSCSSFSPASLTNIIDSIVASNSEEK